MKKFHYLDTVISPNVTEKSTAMSEFNKVVFKVHEGASKHSIKKNIEKISSLTNSFKLIMRVPLCGNCGMKDQTLSDKCPSCKSSYII